jgi:hypothetical protein
VLPNVLPKKKYLNSHAPFDGWIQLRGYTFVKFSLNFSLVGLEKQVFLSRTVHSCLTEHKTEYGKQRNL